MNIHHIQRSKWNKKKGIWEQLQQGVFLPKQLKEKLIDHFSASRIRSSSFAFYVSAINSDCIFLLVLKDMPINIECHLCR